MVGCDMTERPTTTREALPELLSLRQLADYLGIAPSSIHYWRQQGKGPRGFRIGKQLRFRAADVDAWLQEQEERSHR
jgi:excisionase family DNA binding protein